MNTKQIGDISEAMIAAALLKSGRVLLKPFGDNQRYDLVIDDGGRFLRVQCKTGRLKNGAIEFSFQISYHHTGGSNRSYFGEIEYFAVYCPQNNKVYLVPEDECGLTTAKLRIDAPKGGQTKGIRYAEAYEIGEGVTLHVAW
jgi:hypothetical protein